MSGRARQHTTWGFVMKRAAAVILLFGVTPAAHAQTDFGTLRLKPGDLVYVTEPNGTETRGRVTTLTPSALQIDDREFKPAPGLRIAVPGDPVWDGALKGLLIGTLAGLATSGYGECAADWAVWQCTLVGAMWVAGFGALIDRGHSGRTTVYVGVSAAPSSTAPSPRPAATSALARGALLVRVRF